jgi:hypothetical protein
MSLTLGTIPGFSEIPDANFAAGAAASDVDMKALNADAKFGIVRNEQVWGYFKHGDTVPLPVSPADGYAYARNELRYTWSVYWTGAAVGTLAGTQATPTRGATSGQGTLLQVGYSVDQATGAVSCVASYFKTSQTDTNDGILLVVTHAQRLR